MQRRLVALLLLAVFLGAGTTLPDADALLFHWSGASEQLVAHVEPAGGCGSHSERCTLGRTATGSGSSLAESQLLRTAPAGQAPVVRTPSVPRLTAKRGILPQPRAPPAPAV